MIFTGRLNLRKLISGNDIKLNIKNIILFSENLLFNYQFMPIFRKFQRLKNFLKNFQKTLDKLKKL